MPTHQFIEVNKLNITRQTLWYWRKAGLFKPNHQERNGHYQYTFEDIKTLKTISLLRDKGISVKKIKLCIDNIKDKFPQINNPLIEKQLLVFGKKLLFVHDQKIYDAQSMQGYLVNFVKIDEWTNQLRIKQPIDMKYHKVNDIEDENFFIDLHVNSL